MLSEKFPIQQLDRFPRFMTPVSGRRPNADLNPATKLRFRKNGTKKTADRISKVAVQSIFKLCMTQDRKQFRNQLDVAVPDLAFRSCAFSGAAPLFAQRHCGVRIICEDRLQDGISWLRPLRVGLAQKFPGFGL